MQDRTCIAFLQWALPRLGLQWAGYRKVRGTVCKRVARRIRDLGLSGVDGYRAQLEREQSEWEHFDAMCRIPISRFWRDRAVFDRIAGEVLPALAAAAVEAGRPHVRAWSAGCASGEEPYSLRLAWELCAAKRAPSAGIRITATDAEATMLSRARAGIYRASSLRDLPRGLIGRAFTREGELYRISPVVRRDISFVLQDIRVEMPDGPFDLVLVRNLIFTYFDPPTQSALLARLEHRLCSRAVLVIGGHEALPEPHENLVHWDGPAPIYQFHGEETPDSEPLQSTS